MKSLNRISLSNPILVVVFLLLVSIATSSPSAYVGRGPRVGGWQPIENVNDPNIQKLAKFALTEHNNKVQGKEEMLKFGRVLSGEQQVVSGMNYKLIIAASNVDGKDGKYEAIVWVRAWENFKKLTSFRSV